MATVASLFMWMDIGGGNALPVAAALCVFNVFVVYMCIAISCGSQRQLVNRGAHTSAGSPPAPPPPPLTTHTYTVVALVLLTAL